MWPTIVVKTDPISNNVHRMLQTFEEMSVNALLLQRLDNSLDHHILLRAMRGNESPVNYS